MRQQRVTTVSESQPERQKLQLALDKRISRLFGKCLDNMMVLANGVLVENTESDAEQPVYQKPPDRAANEYILNRILGRPATRKPLTELSPTPPLKLDLSRIPLDRLVTMERWLTEADAQTYSDSTQSPELDHEGNAGGDCGA